MSAVERMRRLWRNEETGIELQPRPLQPGGPPIWLGGSGPRMLRLAGTTFDGWLPFSPTPSDYASGFRAVREAAEAGIEPDASVIGLADAVYRAAWGRPSGAVVSGDSALVDLTRAR